MFARGSEPSQESIPSEEDDATETKNLNNNNREENRSPSCSEKREGDNNGNGSDNGDSPLQEIDEHYVCDIAMMRIGGGEVLPLPVTHKAPAPDDSQSSEEPLANNASTNNGNELEIDRQEEEQAVSDLVRSSSAGALMEA